LAPPHEGQVLHVKERDEKHEPDDRHRALCFENLGFRHLHDIFRQDGEVSQLSWLDAATRRATLTVSAPEKDPESDIAAIEAAGANWWPLAMARELDDAILQLRTNHLEYGVWILRTRGSAEHVLAADQVLAQHASHWFVRECIGMLRRTFARLDVSSRSLFALVEPGSCFAGTLLELALAADRSYMLDGPREASRTRAWFAAVVRHFVRRAQRSDERRARREAGAAQPERVDSTTEIMARAQASSSTRCSSCRSRIARRS